MRWHEMLRDCLYVSMNFHFNRQFLVCFSCDKTSRRCRADISPLNNAHLYVNRIWRNLWAKTFQSQQSHIRFNFVAKKPLGSTYLFREKVYIMMHFLFLAVLLFLLIFFTSLLDLSMPSMFETTSSVCLFLMILTASYTVSSTLTPSLEDTSANPHFHDLATASPSSLDTCRSHSKSLLVPTSMITDRGHIWQQHECMFVVSSNDARDVRE